MKNRILRRFLPLLLSLTLGCSLFPVSAADSGYQDVPADSWAAESIERATAYGLMNGIDDGIFGYGRSLRRSEFITLLVRLFRWELPEADGSRFTDVSANDWFAPYLTAAADHGVIDSGAFRPAEAVTREDMAVFFVRALGYEDLTDTAALFPLPFTDISAHAGDIAVAYDLGLVNGMTAATFAPGATATREQAAAMLVRVYERYYHETDFLHGFYAISSYSQLDLAGGMDAVSAGWSRMTLDESHHPLLRTTSADGNEFYVPAGYSEVVETLAQQRVPLHLSVYMDTSVPVVIDGVETNTLYALLSDPQRRTAAVESILAELTASYRTIGYNPYAGVTIDFEGLKGEAVKADFTAFLTELSAALNAADKALYVTVQPSLSTGAYYDGFDFRAIGRLADKVILMAHDYAPTSLTGFEGTTYYRNAALTPLHQVYYSLRAATDKASGVEDVSKLVLAVSCTSMAWELNDNGLLSSPTPLRPSQDTVYRRMQQADTVKGWSETYRNPYLTYTTEEGDSVFLWYEDSRSVEEKVALAKLFGISGVSLWRLGTIPDYDGYSIIEAVS